MQEQVTGCEFTLFHVTVTTPIFRSRDVIGHDSILHMWLHIDGLLEPWNEASVSNRFRDIRLQSARVVPIVTAHERYQLTYTPYPKCGYIVSHPHIACSLWHFYWAPMKNNGCLLLRLPMLNAKSSKNFVIPDQNWANFGGFGGLGVWGYNKFKFLLQKAHNYVRHCA